MCWNVKSLGVVMMATLMLICPILSFGAERTLSGAGATFPEPLYSKMFDIYNRQYGTRIQYQGIGSGAGMRDLIAKRVDFAGTDIYLSVQDSEEGVTPLVRIPTCLGAVAIIYNLPDNPKVRFSSDVVAEIFLGRITKWNDPKIVSLNKEARLPDMAIAVVYRADESGTTHIFTDYLSKTSLEWAKSMGKGTSAVNWPRGQGAKGNPGVTGMVKQIPGSIGYAELTYAVANNMSFGAIQNKSGKFVEPSPHTVTIAAKAAGKCDNDISITDTSAPEGYPISGFTWLVVYREQAYEGRSRETAEELVKMLNWITHEGQRYAAPLRYVPLPGTIVKKAEAAIRSITYKGTPIQRKRHLRPIARGKA